MWTGPGTIFGTWCTWLMAELAAFRMIAANLAWFCAKRTGHIAMAWSFAAMAAGRVWSSTFGITNTMHRLGN
ncbi:hypothetical protein V491_05835 [Pseudogymnoascus sp. VKM F-3775]|nr:hypothetical protein V491_05835 [Pseudogymnoascus sp. VKM F-3775]